MCAGASVGPSDCGRAEGPGARFSPPECRKIHGFGVGKRRRVRQELSRIRRVLRISDIASAQANIIFRTLPCEFRCGLPSSVSVRDRRTAGSTRNSSTKRARSGGRAPTPLTACERLRTRRSPPSRAPFRSFVAIQHEVDRLLDESAQAGAVAGRRLRQALELPQRDREGLRNRSPHDPSRRPGRKQVDYLKIIPAGNASSGAPERATSVGGAPWVSPASPRTPHGLRSGVVTAGRQTRVAGCRRLRRLLRCSETPFCPPR